MVKLLINTLNTHTMTQLTGSWKKHVDFKYLAGEDFINKTVNMTVSGSIKDEAYNQKSRRNEPVVVLHFEGTDKGIILNKTNARAIELLMGTDKIDEWVGKQIPFYGQPDKRHGHIIKVKPDFSSVKM